MAEAAKKMEAAPTQETPAAGADLLNQVIKQTEDLLPGFGSLRSFELMQRQAKCFASSTLVPKEYQGNISNCTIALNMAQRLGADPLMVMQNLVIVHGRPTWSSQFLIATVNTCGRFTALRYEFFGEQGTDSWGCRAWAIEKSTGEKLIGTDITIGLAKKEGWYDRKAKDGSAASKWPNMPQQMLMYRSGAWWTRSYAPELSMGLHTEDEIRDSIDPVAEAEKGITRTIQENANAGPVIGADTTAETVPAGASAPNNVGMTEEEIAEALKKEQAEGAADPMNGKRGPGF